MLVPAQRYQPTKNDWLQAALVAAVLFILYALTSPRSVALEDDGLFILSSYFLGVEHPPGYPLFTLIGHLFSKLPFGSVAYRVHLASALFGGLTGAAAWLCARSLLTGRLPAYLAAFGLGLSPVFWSQSIIAEVYTLNTFFLLVLVFLGLQICPPSTGESPTSERRHLLFAMAFLFGLSLSNHWPLMLLVAPAFLILLSPVRFEILKRLGVLLWLVLLGLLPYAWLVRRSWMAIPINFDGPLETLPEMLFFFSRAGYANIDQSVSADWFDRIKYFEFLAGQLFVQFAVVGALLAGIGFVVQWRVLGRRLGAFLSVAFVMPSAVLLLLLGFDYSPIAKHVFHVYPLPAYAIAALWMALGFAWLANRLALRPMHAVTAGAALVALVFVVGSRENLFENHDWGARYAQTVLKTLPPNASVFLQGDADLAPIAYFHMIENWRPDITLYHAKGLVLGNRLFHPLRTSESTQQRLVREMIAEHADPIVFTLDVYTGNGRRDRWLYSEVDKSSTDALAVSVDIPEEAVRFFEESVAGVEDKNAWIAFLQGELRRRYATLLAQWLPRDRALDERTRRHLQLLDNDFYGALGIAEGLMLNKQGYSVGAVAGFLEKVKEMMPSDVAKQHVSRFFYLRGAVRADLHDNAGAIGDFETAVSVWPVPTNVAFKPLEDLYRQTGNTDAVKAVEDRVKTLERRKR